MSDTAVPEKQTIAFHWPDDTRSHEVLVRQSGIFDAILTTNLSQLLYSKRLVRSWGGNTEMKDSLYSWARKEDRRKNRRKSDAEAKERRVKDIYKKYAALSSEKEVTDDEGKNLFPQNIEACRQAFSLFATLAAAAEGGEEEMKRLSIFLRVVNKALFSYDIALKNFQKVFKELRAKFELHETGTPTARAGKEAHHAMIQRVLLSYVAMDVTHGQVDYKAVGKIVWTQTQTCLNRYKASKKKVPRALKPLLGVMIGCEDDADDNRKGIRMSPDSNIWLAPWDGEEHITNGKMGEEVALTFDFGTVLHSQAEVQEAFDKLCPDLTEERRAHHRSMLEKLLNDIKTDRAIKRAQTALETGTELTIRGSICPHQIVRTHFRVRTDHLAYCGGYGYMGRTLAPSKKAINTCFAYVRSHHPNGNQISEIELPDSKEFSTLSNDQRCLSGLYWKLKDVKGRHILGIGGYGVASVAKWQGEDVVFKVEAMAASGLVDYERSLDMMCIVHQNILPVLAYFPILPQEYTQDHKADRDKPFLFATIMPWCHGGDLEDYQKDLRKEYDSYKRLGRILPLLAQVLEVVEVLTKNGFVHRDIKPGNLFFLDKDRLHILVADFGVARHVVVGTKITAGVGTKIYWPPESEREGISRVDFESKHDLYSLCVIGVELMMGKFVSSDAQKKQYTATNIRKRYFQQKLKNTITNDKGVEVQTGVWKYAELLAQGLSEDKAVRPSVEHFRKCFDDVCDTYYAAFPDDWVSTEYSKRSMEARRRAKAVAQS
uniref:Protein kinase domain-containing protein n=1 Tax=Amphora coffeiformis TaxID=265554 RepID=A0A7S3PDP3_9STRA|mmetsp:Transcript_12697/g.24131  ORF Transcript_12697/g.24131 Transcript_12697/m.24131 type:complete len:771 (+) Transcript_12697:160-2472(+)|eukprot:scaffold3042_cov152-Amphora_coffeaeformis.AAC.4